ncbi:MAG: hypothetical protein ACFFDK_14765 [Promethearchaeota archaeon]
MSDPNYISIQESPSRWTKLRGIVKKGFKTIIPIAVGWASGIFFPPAGAALYQFLKDKMNKSSVPIQISDELLYSICTKTISELSLDLLQDELKDILRESTETSKEQIEMVVGTLLRPLNDTLNDALAYIKKFPDQISYLMEEWKAENEELINQFHLDMEAGFNEIKSSIKTQTQKIDEILKRLIIFENRIDKGLIKSVESIFSSETISKLDLKVLSNAQLSSTNYSSRFDINFNPDLFEPRIEVDNAFRDFLRNLSSPFSTEYIFLVLSGAGMGKTWTSAYWVGKLSNNEFDFEETKNLVPFFIPLKSNLQKQLQGYFNASDGSSAIHNLKRASITSGLRPILFFDGLDEIKPDDIKSSLNFISDLAKNEIPVVLTCRDSDWAREYKIRELHSDINELCFKHSAGETFQMRGVSCIPSLYLGIFNDYEFNKVIKRYQISREVFHDEQLRDMAKRPILLRLFSEYYKSYGYLPNPRNPIQFQDIFLGKEGDPPEKSIIGRLGIFGRRKNYIVRLTKLFAEKGNELTEDDLDDLSKDVQNYRLVRSAGLIQEKEGLAAITFMLNKLYQPHLEHMAQLAGLLPKKPIKSISEPMPQILPETKPQTLIEPKPKEIIVPEEKRVIFKKKAVKVSEIEVLEKLQKELNKDINSNEFDVNNQGSVDTLDLSSIYLEKVPNTITYFPNLVNINFSNDSFVTDDGILTLINKGLKITIEGEPYVEGQVKARIAREYEEKVAKMETEKQVTELIPILKPILQEKILASVNDLSKEIKAPFEIVKLSLEKFAFWDEETKQFWIPFEEAQKDKIIIFRDAHIVSNDIYILKDIEKLIGKKLKYSKSNISDLTRRSFTVENNQVNEIALYRGGLLTLPESIGKLQALQTLYLAENRLESLPDSIGNLILLKNLDLGYNQLTSLPESIGELQLLETLNLWRNKLTTLPKSIENLESLKRLNIRRNKLKTIPETIEILERRGVKVLK